MDGGVLIYSGGNIFVSASVVAFLLLFVSQMASFVARMVVNIRIHSSGISCGSGVLILSSGDICSSRSGLIRKCGGGQLRYVCRRRRS